MYTHVIVISPWGGAQVETDLLPLGEAMRRLRMTSAAVQRLALRGGLSRVHTPFGWGYSLAEVEALAKQRAETLEITGLPGRPRRREGASA